MIKKILFFGGIVIPVISVLTASRPVNIMGDGAPASSTGAPSENSCTLSGCHDSYSLNSGTALWNISITPDVQEYIPGNKYAVKISVADNNVSRFGFQFVALKDKDLSNAGNIVITNAARTQVIYNYIALKDRQYATYTYLGSGATSLGKSEWTFDWIAPAQNEGTVSLYAAVSSANNDGTDKGDYIFTKSFQLNESSVSGIGEQKNKNRFKLSLSSNPNPSILMADFFLQEASAVQLNIYDLTGEKQIVLADNSFNAGTHTLTFELGKKLSAGLYIVCLQTKEQSVFKKIVIQ